MNKNLKVALIVLLAIGATLTVFKLGVKKAVETSLNGDHSHPQTSEGVNPSASPATNGTTETEAGKGGATSSEGSSSTSTSQSAQPGQPVAATGSHTEVKKEAPPAPENNCFAYEYRHTKDAQNKDIEDFLDYSNAFPVLHKNVNEKSICVKVNNKPVAFKMNKNKSQDEVMIGAVVGPESVIKVSYCIGKVSCKEACAVKSNRFMDDMMSDAGDEDEFKDSWGDSNSAAHAAKKKELQGKVKELRSVASENKDLAQRSVIRTWDTIQKQEWVCKK